MDPTPITAVVGIPILPALALLSCIVLFVSAFVAPRRSRRMQRWFHSWLERSKAKAVKAAPDDAADATAEPFDRSRSAVDHTAQAGRAARDHSPF